MIVKKLTRATTAALAILLITACAPREKSVRPGVNKEFEGDVDVDRWTERFEGESREVYRERERVVELMDLQPGMAVADIGAGTGFFSMLFAERVGSGGVVYAVDIADEFLQAIRDRAADSPKHSNIRTVLCKADSVELPPSSVDVAFICDTYHHFEYPLSTMRSLHRAMRPGGVVYVIDFIRIEGKSRAWIIEHVRAGQDEFRREIESVGFEHVPLDADMSFFEENYIMKFRRTKR